MFPDGWMGNHWTVVLKMIDRNILIVLIACTIHVRVSSREDELHRMLFGQ